MTTPGREELARGPRAGASEPRDLAPGRWALGVAVALGLSVGGGGLAAQDDPGRRGEPPTGVPFELEEPRTHPFQDRLEISFVLGAGSETRRRTSVAPARVGERGEGEVDDRPERATVSIRIFNLLHQRVAWAAVAQPQTLSGRRVRDLEYDAPGRYTAVWDGRAEDGYRVASGPYFVEVVVDGWTAVRKVLFTR